jgi:hypothetical protein
VVASAILPHEQAQSQACAQGHAVRYLGYAKLGVDHELDCERPLQVVCTRDGCQHSELRLCGNHRSGSCGPCSGRYGRRVRRLAARGMALRTKDFLSLVTLTAPGASAHLIGKTGRRCTCTPIGGVDLAQWNPTASTKWNALLLDVERTFGSRPQYFRAVEVQKRCAIHYHVLWRSEFPLTAQALRPLAIRAGFGHEVDVQRLDPRSRAAAAYVSKYVTKSVDSRDDVPWRADRIDKSTGEVHENVLVPARFRAWSSSQRWGSTMAEIREEMRALAFRLNALDQVDEHAAGGQSSLTPAGIRHAAGLPPPIGESPPLPS